LLVSEGVFAQPVDVLEAGGREMHQILVLYRVALGPQLRNYFLHIDRVPHDDRIGQQVQAAHDLLLGFFLFAAQYPVAPKPEPAPQGVQLLALRSWVLILRRRGWCRR